MSESAPERSGYEFYGGYLWPETVRRAYDDAGLDRAVRACRFFFASAEAPARILRA